MQEKCIKVHYAEDNLGQATSARAIVRDTEGNFNATMTRRNLYYWVVDQWKLTQHYMPYSFPYVDIQDMVLEGDS